jgi:asparagine synthase (glutamine-hydrolysing)
LLCPAFTLSLCSELLLRFRQQHILYRQKEQFSDGVGYSWIDGLKAFTDQQVTDEMMNNAAKTFPHNTPVNKEAYYYRMIFERLFPQVI